MRALTVRNRPGRESSGSSSMFLFFSFICSSLLSLLYLDARSFETLPEGRWLAACMALLLLLTAAYSGSCCGSICLPAVTGLMGAVCACAFCLLTLGLRDGDRDCLRLLPALLLVVPLQFIMGVSGMRSSALLRRAMQGYQGIGDAALRKQNIMVLLSTAVAAALTVCIVFR